MALTTGDIAFISFNADEDGWSIVTFVDIEPNTTIYFTDNEATNTTAFNTGESYFEWTSGSSTISGGTVIRFSAVDVATLAASVGTLSRATVSGSSNYGLSASGDVIYAFLGSSAAAPTKILTALSSGDVVTPGDPIANAGLTVGVNAIVLRTSADYGEYSGSRTGQSSFANYKSSVFDVNNWTVDQTDGNYTTTAPNTTNFTINASTPTVTIAAQDANAAEAGSDGSFRISRTGSTTNALTVNYNIGTGAGQATSADYTPNLTGTATIAAGQSFVDITITPVDDATVEGTETVSLTLNSSADYTLGTATATVAIADNDTIRIHDIQGAGHISPFRGQTVSNVAGIVTVTASNGFYLQDPNPDSDDRTSEGIFVFTSSAPTVSVGDSILVTGTVAEFRPGNNANNLTVTQITSPTIVTVSSGNVPTAMILGNGGRTIPTTVIDNDTTGNIETGTTTFDPAQDGIDFYESLEGMRVQVNNPITTSPTASFGTSQEIWVLADNGANATGRTSRGGSLISASDFNPERIQIDDLNNALVLPEVNVGTQLSSITGVVNYDFSNYEVLVSAAPTVVQNSTLQKEVTNLTPTTDQLTVATFNVENLDPSDGATRFGNLASRIVNNLKSPDIISLEEIQDNNGATNDSVVDASTTFQTLINAIIAAGGPTYQYRQINPVDDTNGGEPGGNIRVGFLFNPNRVSFVDRPGGTSTSNTTVTNVSGVPTVSNSPGLIDPTNSAFTSSRKPLVGEFTFNGKTVYIIGNHFNSKGGDQRLYGPNQPPTLSSETQRQQQATLVKNFVQSILAIDPNANIVVAGDLNDFEFSNPVSILESAGLTSLIETLPANERYTYNFEGNAQTLDHILVSNNLLSKLDGYDVVHINSEFADQDSDHDPSLARFKLSANNAPTDIALSATSVNENVPANTVVSTFTTTDPDTGNTFTYSLVTGTGSTDNAAFAIADNSLKINASPDFETKPSYSIRVRSTDNGGLSVEKVLTIQVNNINEAPTLVQPIDDQIISTDKPFSFNVSNKFTDVDQGDTLSYSATALPTGSSIVASTGVISGTIPQVGIFAVTVTATDSTGANVSDSFDLTVANNKATSGNDIIFIDQLNVNIVDALAGSDRVIGTNANETIDGGADNDYLDGKGGTDILRGGDDDDTILGGLGSDTLSGGKDNDRLTGWGGSTSEIDQLNGDQGEDTYLLGNASSVFYASSGNGDYAYIASYKNKDKIELKGVASNYSLGSVSDLSSNKSAVGIFTNNGTELIAVVEDGLKLKTNLATDTGFVFV